MSTTPGATRPRTDDGNGLHKAHRPAPRRETETKASFKTTEFFAFLAVLAGILIAAQVVDESNVGGFGARQAWLYITILTRLHGEPRPRQVRQPRPLHGRRPPVSIRGCRFASRREAAPTAEAGDTFAPAHVSGVWCPVPRE